MNTVVSIGLGLQWNQNTKTYHSSQQVAIGKIEIMVPFGAVILLTTLGLYVGVILFLIYVGFCSTEKSNAPVRFTHFYLFEVSIEFEVSIL